MSRVGALLASFACCLAAASAAFGVFGGTAIDARSAPWAAAVVQKLPTGHGFLCSGSIIDSTHVVTAAHCVFDDKGKRAAPAALTVKAGTKNGLSAAATGREQERVVSSVRVHPGYRFDASLRTAADDVAVLTLGAPLDLSGPSAKAVSLPAPGRAFPADEEFEFAGFGAKAPGTKSDGVLSSARGTFNEQGICVNGLNPLIKEANAIVICGVSPGSGTCEADSGGGLVSTESHTLVGILAGGECAARGVIQSAYVGAPEILRFVRGEDDPPAAPRVKPTTFVRLSAAGSTLRCSSGGWTGSPRLTYAFVSTTDGRVLQQGASTTFRSNGPAAGLVSCRVTATTAGGTATLSAGAGHYRARARPALRPGRRRHRHDPRRPSPRDDGRRGSASASSRPTPSSGAMQDDDVTAGAPGSTGHGEGPARPKRGGLVRAAVTHTPARRSARRRADSG